MLWRLRLDVERMDLIWEAAKEKGDGGADGVVGRHRRRRMRRNGPSGDVF